VILPYRNFFIVAAVGLVSILTIACPAQSASTDWRVRLQQELPLLGHRNWIAIVDSAYPLQTSAGIETIETDSDQLEVVKAVLAQLDKAKHVRPVIFTDAELSALAENDASGVTTYRDALRQILGTKEAQSLPHEQIIEKLDDAGKTFHVLVLKTNLTIPYTSVFLRLDCGYWSDDQEKRLRAKMAGR
jgi:L-fucose mutarotase/ribose pyranase (RbsD/FucU family)